MDVHSGMPSKSRGDGHASGVELMSKRRAGWMAKSAVVLAVVSVSFYVIAQSDDPGESPSIPPEAIEQPMTAASLGELILSVDENAELNGSSWIFQVTDLEVIVVYDIGADRMRILIPIGGTDEMKEDELLRLLQANFDSALDARYAIAQDTLWGTFIHPLSALSDEEFLVGLAQTVNVVTSYGTSYSSGMFIFGGGDSTDIERQRLIEELRNIQT
jgi:hypothetical protein